METIKKETYETPQLEQQELLRDITAHDTGYDDQRSWGTGRVGHDRPIIGSAWGV